MDEKFTFNCSVETFFEDYLRLKRPYINALLTHLHKEKSVLSDNPLRVLAQLLYQYYMLRDMDEDMRWKVMFDYDTKVKMADKLDMPVTHFNSYISQLRKLGIMKRKRIVKMFIVYPEPLMKLLFEIKVNVDEK
jgi:hypothetical protein